MAMDELGRSAQDYLKEIVKLELDGRRATTSAIAEALDVSAPSVTEMTKRLAERGLVEREPYRGVVLTAEGRRAALELVRRHRLLERFLVSELGLPIADVHAEAERMEHVLSDAVQDRMDAALGFPRHDPHGEPIPDGDLNVAPASWRPLLSLAVGETSVVARVPDEDAELLAYLDRLALVPGRELTVVAAAPFGGPLTVRTETGEHAISRELASAVGVS
jgi:DtxR family Mn-dependent transcriptional regulator